MKFFYLILIVFFACDNLPEPFECGDGLIMDNCGVCGGNNEDLDECGVCYGDGKTYECTSGQIACEQSDCNSPFENLPIDLNFLTENAVNITFTEHKIFIAINFYFIAAILTKYH